MIRTTLFVLAVIGTAATALAAVQPVAEDASRANANITVIHKNEAFPVYGPIVVEQCQVEDCSDVQS